MIEGTIQRAWSPTTGTSRLEMEGLMKLYSSQIPHSNGLRAILGMRDMIGKFFPGAMPAPAAIAITTSIAANAISSILDELEGSLSMDTPEAVGRRQAVVEFFTAILNGSANQREQARLKSMMAGLAN